MDDFGPGLVVLKMRSEKRDKREKLYSQNLSVDIAREVLLEGTRSLSSVGSLVVDICNTI